MSPSREKALAHGYYKLQPQGLVITMLGSYLRPRTRRFWSGGTVELLREFGFSPGAARIALVRLVNSGFLERTRIGRLSFYNLTSRSRKLLKEGDDRIFSLGGGPLSTDCWTVFWHAIPEDERRKRERLSRRLRFLGFGSLQAGTWLSPHNREAEAVKVIEDLDIQQFCGVLLGSPAEVLDFRTVVTRMWPVDELSERYRRYLNEFKPYARDPSLTDQEAFLACTRAVDVYRRFLALDPLLPDDYMSAPQYRDEATDVFRTLFENLAGPAGRHFDKVTQGPPSASTTRREPAR